MPLYPRDDGPAGRNSLFIRQVCQKYGFFPSCRVRALQWTTEEKFMFYFSCPESRSYFKVLIDKVEFMGGGLPE